MFLRKNRSFLTENLGGQKMGNYVVYGLYTLLLAERLYLTQGGKNSIILKLASVAQSVEQLIRNFYITPHTSS